MKKIWEMIKERSSFVVLMIDLGDSIREAAIIEKIPLTLKQSRALAQHILADIRNGRL